MWYHPDHVHTMYTIQHFLHAMYFIMCYNNYMIEENCNYKVMFYFLSPKRISHPLFASMIFCIRVTRVTRGIVSALRTSETIMGIFWCGYNFEVFLAVAVII